MLYTLVSNGGECNIQFPQPVKLISISWQLSGNFQAPLDLELLIRPSITTPIKILSSQGCEVPQDFIRYKILIPQNYIPAEGESPAIYRGIPANKREEFNSLYTTGLYIDTSLIGIRNLVILIEVEPLEDYI